MKTFLDWVFKLGVGIVLGFLLFKGCGRPRLELVEVPAPPPEHIERPGGVAAIDSVPYPVYMPGRVDSIPYPVLVPIALSHEDTLEIVRRALTTYYLADVYTDSTGRVRVTILDSLRGSRNVWRSVDIEFLKPETLAIVPEEPSQKPARFVGFLGLSAGFGMLADRTGSIGLELLINDRHNEAVYGVGLETPGVLQVHYLRKISFRRGR